MDFNKLSQGERIIAISGVLLLVFAFFPWFGLETPIFELTRNGWDNVLSLLAVLLGIIMVLQVVLANFTTVQLPALPVPWGQVHLGLGVLAFVLVLLQVLLGDEVGGVDFDRKVGAFLGLLAALGLAAGGFVRSKEPEAATGLSR